MIPISAILKAASFIGGGSPAFDALLKEVMPLFSSEDQTTLKAALVKARAKSDDVHRKTQGL